MASAPDYIAYNVRDRGVDENGEKRKNFWHRIGSASKHEKGDGYTVYLDSVPIDGKIVLRRPKEDDDKTSGEGGTG